MGFALPDPRALSKKDLVGLARYVQVLLYVDGKGVINLERGEFTPDVVIEVLKNELKELHLDPTRL